MMATEFNFIPGQVWKYNTRPGEEQSTITILEREEYASGVIVHIRVDGILMTMPSGTTTNQIKHLPFSEAVLNSSVTELVGHTPEVTDFLPGYTHWKKAFDEGKAGFWKIAVHEVIDAVCKLASDAS